MPLYIFYGEFLLAAKLRPSNTDSSFGALGEIERIVAQIRSAWPKARIILRGDSGFCREPNMAWGEAHAADHLFGLARNARLEKEIEEELAQAGTLFEQTKKAARVFKEFSYQTLKSWSRTRRVVAKAEQLGKGANPRFSEGHRAQGLSVARSGLPISRNLPSRARKPSSAPRPELLSATLRITDRTPQGHSVRTTRSAPRDA